jgi:hypothetical protein
MDAGRTTLADQVLQELRQLDGEGWSLDIRLMLAASSGRTMSITEAEAEIRQVLDIQRRSIEEMLSRKRHPGTYWASKPMFHTWNELASLLEADGRLPDAATEYQELLSVLKRISPRHDTREITLTRERLQAVQERIAAESERNGKLEELTIDRNSED